MEEQRGEIDALMLDLWSDGLRVIINDKGGFRDMFDAKGYSYGNDNAADEFFGGEREIVTLIEMFGNRAINPGDSDAIKRFFRINLFCGRRKDKWLNA